MATLDVVTDAEARAYVKASATDATPKVVTALPLLTTAVSLRLDKCVGPIVQRILTAEQHDGGKCHIRLRRFPILSFTSVTEYWLSAPLVLTRETVGTAPSSSYYAEPYGPDATLFNGKLFRREGGTDYRFYPGRGNVAVTYVAGRFANTGAVDGRFKDAAGIMLRYLWEQYGLSTQKLGDFDVPVANFPKFAVPNAVKDLLGDVWQLGPMAG